MSDTHWFVAKTNPRCEDRAVASIEGQGFEAYFPKSRVEVRHNRTKEWLVKERVLLMGYVFFGMPSDKRKQHFGVVRRCDGVQDILGRNAGQVLRIPTADVMRFKEMEEQGAFDILRRSSIKRPFSAGERVAINAGPFSDLTGVVRDYRGRDAIRVMVTILGGLVPVEVGIKDVRKVA